MSKLKIIVTGSSRGIGKATYQMLRDRGCYVIGHSSRIYDEQPDNIIADLSDNQGAKLLWDHALDRCDGRIDAIINNAGIFEANPITDSDVDWNENWRRTMNVNLDASAQMCRFAVNHWSKNNQEGRIINIASRAAYRGDSPDHWHYAASKAGMVAMTKTIARAYANRNIYAFGICPGFTMTGMAEDYLESRGGDKLLADIPLGKVADPSEIAEIATFCVLNAPPSMTGSILDANGASYVR